MWRSLCLVVLVVRCTIAGELHESTLQRQMNIAEGSVEMGILRDFSSTLEYLDGNCSWRLTSNIGGLFEVVDREVAVAPQTILEGTGSTLDFTLKCVSNGIVELTALIILYGERYLLSEINIFCITEVNEVPSPVTLSLDSVSGIISWSHVFQPSDLPPEFELDHGFTISYLVNVTDRDRSGERVESLASNETSLNVSQYLDHCSRQEFTVQALVNGVLSQSRSLTTNSTGEWLLR